MMHAGRVVAALAVSVAGVATNVTVGPLLAAGLEKSAMELFIQCDSRNSAFHQGYCLGFLVAHVRAMQDAGTAPGYCLPENVPPERLRQAFVDRLQADADLRQVPVDQAIATSLSDAFPCS